MDTGRVSLIVGEVDMAEQAWSIAISLDPTHAEALNDLGVMLKERGKDASARVYYERSRTAKADSLEPWFNGATDAMERRDLQKAFAFLRRALEISPDHTESGQLFADVLSELSQN